MNGDNVVPTIGGIPLVALFEMRQVDPDDPLDRPIYASAPLPDGSLTEPVSASTVGEYATLARRVVVAQLEAIGWPSGDVQKLIAQLRIECESGMPSVEAFGSADESGS